MDANELGRWTRFASKGGIGKCFATQDCVAEGEDDLMFLTDDEIIVLMQLPGKFDFYLGYCEGVVGRFRGSFVRFDGKLKRPVMTKRSSSTTPGLSSSRPPSEMGVHAKLAAAPGASVTGRRSATPVLDVYPIPFRSHSSPRASPSPLGHMHEPFASTSVPESPSAPIRPTTPETTGMVPSIHVSASSPKRRSSLSPVPAPSTHGGRSTPPATSVSPSVTVIEQDHARSESRATTVSLYSAKDELESNEDSGDSEQQQQATAFTSGPRQRWSLIDSPTPPHGVSNVMEGMIADLDRALSGGSDEGEQGEEEAEAEDGMKAEASEEGRGADRSQDDKYTVVADTPEPSFSVQSTPPPPLPDISLSHSPGSRHVVPVPALPLHPVSLPHGSPLDNSDEVAQEVEVDIDVDVDFPPTSAHSSEPSARLSQISTTSDGGFGIGLTMLQNFMNGAGSDTDTSDSEGGEDGERGDEQSGGVKTGRLRRAEQLDPKSGGNEDGDRRFSRASIYSDESGSGDDEDDRDLLRRVRLSSESTPTSGMLQSPKSVDGAPPSSFPLVATIAAATASTINANGGPTKHKSTRSKTLEFPVPPHNIPISTTHPHHRQMSTSTSSALSVLSASFGRRQRESNESHQSHRSQLSQHSSYSHHSQRSQRSSSQAQEHRQSPQLVSREHSSSEYEFKHPGGIGDTGSTAGSEDYMYDEEWEGASDIYDNYRYSRMSMASKMSRFSRGSRFSFGPGGPVPPVPPATGIDGGSARPSLDSIRTTGTAGTGVRMGGVRERLESTATASSVESVLKVGPSPLGQRPVTPERRATGSTASPTSPLATNGGAGNAGAAGGNKRIPAPLMFGPEVTNSGFASSLLSLGLSKKKQFEALATSPLSPRSPRSPLSPASPSLPGSATSSVISFTQSPMGSPTSPQGHAHTRMAAISAVSPPPRSPLAISTTTANEPTRNSQASAYSDQTSLASPTSPQSPTSPLLHATFGSPLSSPTQLSTGNTLASGGFGRISMASSTSPKSMTLPLSPMFPPPPDSTGGANGVASALRQRLEGSRSTTPSSTTSNGNRDDTSPLPSSPPRVRLANTMTNLALPIDSRAARLSTQPIIMEDEEGVPSGLDLSALNGKVEMTSMEGVSAKTSASQDDGDNDGAIGNVLVDSSATIVKQREAENERISQTPGTQGSEGNEDDPAPPYTPATPTTPLSPTLNGNSSAPNSPLPQVFPVGVPIPRPPRSPQGGTRRTSPTTPLSSSRTSLFLPHPHAPKPAANGRPPSIFMAGMFGTGAPLGVSASMRGPPGGPIPGPVPGQGVPSGPPPGSVLHTMRAVLAAFAALPPGALGPPGALASVNVPPFIQMGSGPPIRRPTLFGMTEVDMASSIGPVPIWFSLEPPNNVPANRYKVNTISRPGTAMSGTSEVQQPPTPTQARPNMNSVPPSPVVGSFGPAIAVPIPSTPTSREGLQEQQQNEGATGQVIPRANFFPKAKTARPRSRSFSGFDSQIAEIELVQEKISEETFKKREELPPVQTLNKRSKSASAMVVSGPATTPQRASVSHTAANSRSLDRKPSPLSLSQNNLVAGPPTTPVPVAPKSPLSNPPIYPPAPPSPNVPNIAPPVPPAPPVLASTPNANPKPTKTSLERVLSPPLVSSPKEPTSPLARSFVPSTPPQQGPNRPERSETLPNPARSSPSPNNPTSSIMRRSRSSVSVTSRPSVETDTSSHSHSQGHHSQLADRARASSTSPLANMPSPPPVPPPSNTLRSKLSLPSLRIRSNDRGNHLEVEKSPTFSVTTPNTPTDFGTRSTVQVEDAEFELVQLAGVPSIMMPSSLPESPTLKDDGSLPPPSPINPDNRSLRANSPASSLVSTSSGRARGTLQGLGGPGGSTNTPNSSPKPPASAGTTAEAEAYRKRELAWISTISSIPASQSRKSKKVRGLLRDGVPSSVRYLVWAYLTDSKAKRIEGLYAKLGKRERVAASASIERDVGRFVEGHRQVPDSSLVVNLLQAYLTMVPDVQYSRGLVAIAGLLLLQSPEEDAFWTFISLMDSHIRPYFSAHPIQLEVDTVMFARCLESNEPALAKKLFGDLGLPAIAVCRPWFTSLFVDMLPPEHLHRVWDIFLYEGVPFLFRVALAICTCCKSLILSASLSRDAVLSILLSPSASALPAQPDAFLEVAFGMKMKDDDIRKQRSRLMESQTKKQTQTRVVSRPSISLPRS